MTKYRDRKIVPDFFQGTGIAAELINVRNIHPHYHNDTLEFIYVIEGNIFANVAHESCTINPGELVTVDQEDFRNIFALDNNITMIVHLNLNNSPLPIEDLRNTLFSCASFLYKNKTKHINDIIDCLLALMYSRCLFQDGVKNEQWFTSICDSIRLNIIDTMIENFSWFSIYGEPEYDMKYRKRLRQVIAYVSEHCDEKITLSQLSKIIYLNPAYISTFLRRTPFDSFAVMVNYYRCLRAQKLLIETDTPVGDISSLCSFSSEKYFYRSFKYFFNTTPLKYRKLFNGYFDKKEEYTCFEPRAALEIVKDHMTERHIEKCSRRPETPGSKNTMTI